MRKKSMIKGTKVLEIKKSKSKFSENSEIE